MSSTSGMTGPWGPLHEPILQGVNMAETLMGTPPAYYSGSTVNPFSQTTEQAMQARYNRAMQGSPQEQAFGGYLSGAMGQGQFNLAPAGVAANQAIGGMGAGTSQLAQTAGGANLYGNPFLDAQFNAASANMGQQFDRAASRIDASFGGGGRAGSNAHAQAMGDAAGQFSDSLSSLGANIYGGNYQAERDRQMQASNVLQQGGLAGGGLLGNLYGNVDQSMARAATMTPAHSAMQYGNIDQLGQVGSMVDQQAQNYLQDDINRFNFSQQAPWDRVGQYMGIVNSPSGGTMRQTGGGPGDVAQALGGAGTGAATGYMVGGPWGAAAGGIIGLGLGLFG